MASQKRHIAAEQPRRTGFIKANRGVVARSSAIRSGQMWREMAGRRHRPVLIVLSGCDRVIAGIRRLELPISAQTSTADGDLATFVRRSITASLPGGVLSVVGTAEAAGLSVRGLQRRLAADGLTYSQLLDEARRDLAFRLIEARGPSFAEIASVLGYSDPAHFTRAFVRWTGMTPRAYRQRVARTAAIQGLAGKSPRPGT